MRHYALLVALGWASLAWAAPPNQTDKNTQANASQAVPPPTYKPYPDRNSEGCYQSTNHDSADLCAQWSAADAAKEAAGLTKWGNIISAVGAVLSFASVILVLCALRQGREANRISRKQYGRNRVETKAAAKETTEALRIAGEHAGATAETVKGLVEGNSIALKSLLFEQRAWLYPQILAFREILFTEHGVQLTFDYRIKNTGRTHAELAFNYGTLASADFPEQYGESLKVAERTQGQEARLVFPDEVVNQTQIGLVRTAALLRDGERASVSIIVGVYYRTALDEAVRYTIRSFDIYDSNDSGNITPIIFGSEIPPERLRYTPRRQGNIAT